MRIVDCGLIGFQKAFAIQEKLAAGIAAGTEEETLMLLEHYPIYTVGCGGNSSNILDPEISVERVNRGGDVTWHGPGQIVGYPLIDLGKRGRDLHCWLRFLEELMIISLSSFGINGRRYYGVTGVWTGRGKIGFIGVGVRRWVTMHGFCLNVNPDLRVYKYINPCGLPGCPLTSMELEIDPHPSTSDVMMRLTEKFEQLLNERMPYNNSKSRILEAHC